VATDRYRNGGVVVARRVVFDASMLMEPSRDGIGVFDEAERILGGYDAVVPDAVVRELRGLADDGDEDAGVAVELAERCRTVETGETHGDAAVVEVCARDDDVVAATNDARLKDRLLKRNVPVLYPRQRSRLDIDYP